MVMGMAWFRLHFIENPGMAWGLQLGYAGFKHGRVVDMRYIPIIDITLPKWLPFWGSTSFEFFSPVFNTADAWVPTGVIAIFVFQKRLFQTYRESILK